MRGLIVSSCVLVAGLIGSSPAFAQGGSKASLHGKSGRQQKLSLR